MRTNGKTARAKTKWKKSARTRLRICLGCGKVFPSAGAEERMCARCTRRIEDARARACTDNPDRAISEFFDSYFDPDLVDRRKREEKHDSERRIRRQHPN